MVKSMIQRNEPLLYLLNKPYFYTSLLYHYFSLVAVQSSTAALFWFSERPIVQLRPWVSTLSFASVDHLKAIQLPSIGPWDRDWQTFKESIGLWFTFRNSDKNSDSWFSDSKQAVKKLILDSLIRNSDTKRWFLILWFESKTQKSWFLIHWFETVTQKKLILDSLIRNKV